MTLTDEVGRRQKVYSEVLGRTAKTEVLNLDSSVYSTTTNTYNARDQIAQVRQYAGLEGGPTFQDTTMTYDGFGRLKTKHVPEQNVGTATVWDYNSDDTTQKITDARGASQTLSYNNRHLVLGIIYAAPGGSGITVPAAVSFAYDAAGNRTSMTDGVGSMGYTYDQLSRLTAETRGFSVGTYSINYGYNLAGQLTSITDPFGASFAYQRDSQGQLKAVTGSPYAGITNYVTDVTYRAWGAPKSVSYNGVGSTIAYNARMQPAQFRLTHNSNGAGIIRENYGYFGDGRAATLTDLDDTIGTNPPATLRFLSRAYGYDQVGRVTAGYGNGGGGQLIPYTQSYSYDEFGNMTGRSGMYYGYNSNPFLSDSASFTNHRRNGWSYNADGQVIATPSSSTDSPRNMSYDAASRMITSVEFGQSNISTYSAAYDGDGQLVYESSGTSVTTQTSYIVRSTVLGEVLTRLDQSGNKKITHVPAEGLLFATQGTVGGSYVVETYRNPLGTTETGKGVYDPLGNYIPFQRYNDPRPPSGSYNSSSMSSLSTGQANPDSYGVGCLMDGMPTNCNRAMRSVNSGSAYVGGVVSRVGNGIVTQIGLTFDQQYMRVGGEMQLATSLRFFRNLVPGGQTGFEQNPTTPQKTQREKKPPCSSIVSLSGADTDEGAMARLIYQEATARSSAGYESKDHWNEIYAIAASVLNRVNFLGAPGLTQSQTMGFGNPGSSIADVVYSRGSNAYPNPKTKKYDAIATQFAGFTPEGIDENIETRVNNALNSEIGSADCTKLLNANAVAQLGMNARGLDPFGGRTMGLRTAGHGTSFANAQRLGQFGGNVFFGLRR